MKKKSTSELQRELTSAPNLGRFLKDNQEEFIFESFTQMLNALYSKTDISKAALAKRAGTSEVYLHQIFSGGRTPSRDKTLCICVGMNASLEDTQELLKRSGYAQLYPKNRREAIIIYGLTHGMNLQQINDQLFTENETTLC